jgi:hypothetical protein
MSNVLDGLLIGKSEVSSYLKGASDHKLKKWLSAGMPVLVDNGEWLAVKDNLEQWFLHYTRQRASTEALEE